jgi:HlyD family secretion protein
MKSKLSCILVLAPILVFALSSCGSKDTEVDASGIFESTEIIVSSETTGKIMQLDIFEGQDVKAGLPFGLIDTVQLQLRKVQLLSTIEASQSRSPDIETQLAGLKTQIDIAKREKNRFENLVKANAANSKQLDDINSQIQVLEKQLAAQKTILDSSNKGIGDEGKALNYQVEQIDDQIDRSHLSSPVDGTILIKYAEAGEIATPGKPLFKVADLRTMYLKAYITTDQLSKLKIGQDVKVISEYGENDIRTYKGKVNWISSKAEFTPKTVQTRDERANLVYAVKIMVKNDGYLKIGMYGGVKFEKNN